MFIVQHEINDPIVSNSYPECALRSCTNLGTPVGAWIPRERLDRLYNPIAVLVFDVLLQLFRCPSSDPDGIV